MPAKNPLLFVQMMLERSIEYFEDSRSVAGPVFFDRGIPDLVAYAVRFGVDPAEFEKAAQQYRYNSTVFVFPPWRDIFVNDSERKGTFEMYADFHERILAAYRKLQFDLVEVPLETVEIRTTFILERATLVKA